MSLASRGRTPPKPDHPAPKPEEAEAAYREAVEALAAAPDDLDGAMERFRQIRTAYAGTEAAGLAADVRYYGQWMRDRAWDRIGHLYPRYVIASEAKQSP